MNQTLESSPTSTGSSTNPAMQAVLGVLRHWPLIIAVAALGAGAGMLATKNMTPIYEAMATLQFDTNVIRPLSDKDQNVGNYVALADPWETLDTQLRIITSTRVLSRAARDLDLQNDPAFVPNRTAPPPPLEELAATLRGMTSVENIRGTRLVAVKVTNPSPKMARRLAEGIVNAYLAVTLEATASATTEAVAWLNGQVEHYRGELENNEQAIHDFKERNRLPNATVNDSLSMVRMEMQAYGEALTKTRMQKQALNARVSELARMLTDAPDTVPPSDLLASEAFSQLRAAYTADEQEYRQLLAEGKGENHPLVMRAREKMAAAKEAMTAEVKNVLRGAQAELAIVAKQEIAEETLYEEARQRAIELNMKEIEYHRLDRSREQNEKLYGMLLERMKAADLARLMNVSNVRLLDAPVEPKAPVRPRPMTNLLTGVMGGLALGIALAWLRQMSDRTLKSPEDVEEKVGITFLGAIPQFGDNGQVPVPRRRGRAGSSTSPAAAAWQPELIAHALPSGRPAEAARALRTNLMFMSPDRPHKVLLITSAAPAEGKTTVATTLAISLAQGGRRTCIVDCDLRRPRLHRIFDRVGDAGVTNVLIGDANLDEVAKETFVANLSCVPAGAAPPNPADILHSERFRAFVQSLADRFDHVVIDSPPVGAVTDPAVISRLVDGTILVARSDKTSYDLARRAVRALKDVDAHVLGLVLNSIRNPMSYQPYYEYYRTPTGAPGEPPSVGEPPPALS